MGSSPKQPAAPDPAATAAAQTTMNKDSAIAQANLNRINQYSPTGSIEYTQEGVNSDGTPKYSVKSSLSPTEQAKYDASSQSELGLYNLANSMTGQVQDATGKAMSFDGMTPFKGSVDAKPISYGSGANPVQSGIGDVGQVGNFSSNAGPVQSQVAGAGGQKYMPFGITNGVQSSLDYSKLNSLPTDYNKASADASNAVYSQATSRLDPQFQQGEGDIRARLAAQGISENSDAYRREMDNFGRSKTDAYNQANYSAIQAGQAAEAQAYGQALSSRQQGQNEVDTQGQFANTAQGQLYSQIANLFSQNNNAQNQNFSQQLSAANFGNTAQQQKFGQDAQSYQLDAAGQQQRFGQATSLADLFNNAQNQQYTQNMSTDAFNNTAQQQDFAQQSQNAALTNAQRQQQISEASYLRELPINEVAALLGTGGVQGPTAIDTPQVGVAAPDYMGAVNNTYNAQMGAYNQAQQAKGGMFGSIFGALGSLGGAAVLASDIRLKRDIRRVGTLANGIAMYAFKYIGNTAQRFGAMAQEVFKVRPDAVRLMDNGYLGVDYSKVYA